MMSAPQARRREVTAGLLFAFAGGAALVVGSRYERGTTQSVHDAPQHSYTRALLSAAPVPDPVEQRRRREAWRQQRDTMA